jgi:hypothetical protein
MSFIIKSGRHSEGNMTAEEFATPTRRVWNPAAALDRSPQYSTMNFFKPTAWKLAGICLMLHLAAYADPVAWQTNRAAAVEAARNSGKLVLLLGGRETCGNCQYMKYTVCETPSVRQVMDTNYVCWFCLVDNSTEWYVYASGLGSFTLPLICVIDPGAATQYLDRSTATQSVSVFKDRLSSHLPTNAIAVTPYHTSSFRLRWATQSQVQYRVLKSEDLVQWNFVGAVLPGSGYQLEFVDSSPATRCFYRVMGFR